MDLALKPLPGYGNLAAGPVIVLAVHGMSMPHLATDMSKELQNPCCQCDGDGEAAPRGAGPVPLGWFEGM